MQLRYPNEAVPNPLLVLRRAGYAPFTDPKSHEESFTLKMTSEFYPRFHLYLKHQGGDTIFDLHLDQKKASYGDGHMHAGEYDGPAVEREAKRLEDWMAVVWREMRINTGGDLH